MTPELFEQTIRPLTVQSLQMFLRCEGAAQKCEALNARLRERFHLLGVRSDVAAIDASLDVSVCSSTTEGFPNVLLEAATFEIPVIAFDVGGIPEIFEHGKEAWLIGQHDSAALADAVGRFLENPEPFQAMARVAKKRVERDFNMDTKAAQMLAYYQEIMEKE